jgi:antitoxin VapB
VNIYDTLSCGGVACASVPLAQGCHDQADVVGCSAPQAYAFPPFSPVGDCTPKHPCLAYAKAYARVVSMTAPRHVKLFRNGRNQAVRIPREFELPGEDAILSKEGDRLVIEVVPPRSLLALLATLQPIDDDFPPIPDPPPSAVDL